MGVTTLACTLDHELEEDWEVEAQLRTVTAAQWSQLWIIANEIAALEVPGTWHGGNVVGHTSDGHNVVNSLHIDYANPVREFIRLWTGMGLTIPYGPLNIDTLSSYEDLQWLDLVPISDVARFGSAIIRRERFSDGQMSDAIESGAFTTFIRRLKVWSRNQSVSIDDSISLEFITWMRSYRDCCRWQSAKSSPPHEYTIRQWRPEDESDFEMAAAGIREFGYPQSFFDKTYTYFNLDGLKYWTMGEAITETTVLNRDPIECRYES